MRLNLLLARATGGSRREADRWIQAGRVLVNGRPPEAIGMQVDPGSDRVALDGAPLTLPEGFRYVAYYKPPETLVSRRSQGGKPTIFDRMAGRGQGLQAVGRLDFESEGILLLTNDGELAEALLHPRTGLPRDYRVWVSPVPEPDALRAFRSGIVQEGVPIAPTRVVLEGIDEARGRLRVELREGKKREIRHLARAAGLHVHRLVRIAFGPLRLGALRPGQSRPLEASEIRALRRASRGGASGARLRGDRVRRAP